MNQFYSSHHNLLEMKREREKQSEARLRIKPHVVVASCCGPSERYKRERSNGLELVIW